MVNLASDHLFGEEPTNDVLGRCPILAYGVGHVLNDITAACWFTYLLLFLTDMGLTPRYAAVVMLSGQVADAVTTIFAGELIDRFGHFKMWHAGGSMLVAVSFSSVFGGCLLCHVIGIDSRMLQMVGYSISAAVFNVGWAATQVSHMSMVNCITVNPTSRVALTSCRNAFTMIANLSLYAVALAVLTVYNLKGYVHIEIQYHWIAYSSIFIGCCFVGIFLTGTKEPKLKQQIDSRNVSRVPWTYWFKKMLYHQVALVYMLTRLVANISQVPAIIYVFSLMVSVVLQEMRWNCFRLKAYFTAGAILWIFSGIGVFILPSSMHNLMYALSITIGVANALMTVTSISMESILVGEDLYGSAFVYGSLSFLDKISCGIALYVLESYLDSPHIRNSHFDSHRSQSLTRFGAGLVPALCAFLSVLVTFTMRLRDKAPDLLVEPLLA